MIILYIEVQFVCRVFSGDYLLAGTGYGRVACEG